MEEKCHGRASYLLQDYELFLVTVAISALSYALLAAAYVIFRFIFVHFVLRILPPSPKDYGKWAVITGGNSGIGRSYAYHFAKRGTNVILIARDAKTLRNTAEEIRSKHGVQCLYIGVDLTEGHDVFERIAKELEGKDIGILINSAGFSGKMPRRFLSETEKNVLTMIHLHVTAVVYMTRLVLSTMMAKGRGAIVTVSSFSSISPIPRLNVYSSSKAFTDRFTRSIALECAGKGLDIQSLVPGYVSTRMIKFMSIKYLVPSSDTYVDYAERTLGISDYTTGYWLHELLRYFLPYVPYRYRKYFILQSILRIRKLFF